MQYYKLDPCHYFTSPGLAWDYPLAPEKRTINKEELSSYCKRISQIYGISSGQVGKLVTTLYDKKNYVVHHENQKLYLSFGMKLKKIHRVMEFNKSKWLKQYIDFNTHKKKPNAKNGFEKDLFKLFKLILNNSVYGKTMENLRKRVDVRLITDEKK